MKHKKEIFLILLALTFFLNFFSLGSYKIPKGLDKVEETYTEIKTSAGPLIRYEWNQTWGEIDHDDAEGIVIDPLNNIYVVGTTHKGGGDIVLVKYNTAGEEQWNQTWGYAEPENGRDVAVDSSDDVYITGNTINFEDFVLIKYNSSGIQQWNTTWGTTIDIDTAEGIAIDPFDNIYIVGRTNSSEINGDMLLVKFNRSGIPLWNRTWGGIYGDWAMDVAVDLSDNIYMVGSRIIDEVAPGHVDIELVKFNSSGDVLWNRTWGDYTSFEEGIAVALDSLDNIYVVGRTNTYPDIGLDTYSDIVLIKYDSMGTEIWHREWIEYDNEESPGVAVDSYNNVYVGGFTSSYAAGFTDMLLLNYDSNGNLQWNCTWGGDAVDTHSDIALDSYDNIYLTGTTSGYLGLADMVLVRYSKVPEISVNSPIQDEFISGVAPYFNISIFDTNIVSQWYTLNDGGPIVFSVLEGTIDQIEWGLIGDGIVNITFYAMNSAGTEGYAELSVVKDATLPQITIDYPSQDATFGEDPPTYNISIVETNLRRIWYTINDGANNFTVTELSGEINDWTWGRAPYGSITLRFYARDWADNIGIDEVIIIKREPTGGVIPGFNPFLIIGLASLITVIYIKKKLK